MDAHVNLVKPSYVRHEEPSLSKHVHSRQTRETLESVSRFVGAQSRASGTRWVKSPRLEDLPRCTLLHSLARPGSPQPPLPTHPSSGHSLFTRGSVPVSSQASALTRG